jgi:SAM-dependent methyltransferase
MYMNNKEYWDSVAYEKKFTTDLDIDLINQYIKREDTILDFGCGYGRTLNQLNDLGYFNTIGFDISSEMVERGRKENPDLNLNVLKANYSNIKVQKYDAILLFAVLTCVRGNNEQLTLMKSLSDGLKEDGIIYLNDFLLNDDERNLNRYNQYSDKHGQYGIFELPDGAILRHHTEEWLLELFSDFDIMLNRKVVFETMNGNKSKGITLIARKK